MRKPLTGRQIAGFLCLGVAALAAGRGLFGLFHERARSESGTVELSYVALMLLPALCVGLLGAWLLLKPQADD